MSEELRPYSPTWRDRLGAFLLGEGRASPEYARVVEGLVGSRGLGSLGNVNLADLTPGVGQGLAIDELSRARTIGEAIGPALALTPAAMAGGAAIYRSAKSAILGDAANLVASRSARMYNPPVKPPRPFSEDYKSVEGIADEAGKLTRTIDGDPITAKYVVGRQEVGGSDVALPSEALDEIATAITGKGALASPPGMLPSKALGVYRRSNDGRGSQRAILYNQGLTGDDIKQVVAHEVGHGIDDIAGKVGGFDRAGPFGEIPQAGIKKDLARIYSDTNTSPADFRMVAQEKTGVPIPPKYAVSPKTFGYKEAEAGQENMAEAIRAYINDPNYIKSVSPAVAERIRQFVNTNPKLKDVVQFNSLAPIAVAGAGGAAMMAGGGEAKAAEERQLVPVDHDPFAAPAPGQNGAPNFVPVDHDPFASDPKAAFDAASWHQKAMQAADDVMRLGADGATFGLADKAVAGGRALFGSTPYDEALAQERQATADARVRAGLAAIPAEIAGGVLTGGGLAKAGLSAVGGATKAAGAVGAPRMAGRIAGSAADGAALGAASGVGHADTMDAAKEGAKNGALFGGVAGAAAPVVGAAVSKAAGAFAKKPVVPGLDELRSRAQAAYQAAEDAGVVVQPAVVSQLRQNTEGMLAKEGFAPELHQGVMGFLGAVGRAEGQPMTLTGLDVLRKTARNVASSLDPSTARLGSKLVGEVDSLLKNLKPADVMMGDGVQGVKSLLEARSLWQRVAKGDQMEQAMERAANRAAVSGSGANGDNATRQEFRKLLEKGRGWTPDERDALQAVVSGTGPQNMARLVGKIAPDNGGLPLLGQIFGATSTGGATLPAAALGSAAKAYAGGATARNAQAALDLALGGGNAAALSPGMTQAQQWLARNRKLLRLGGIAGSVAPLGTP